MLIGCGFGWGSMMYLLWFWVMRNWLFFLWLMWFIICCCFCFMLNGFCECLKMVSMYFVRSCLFKMRLRFVRLLKLYGWMDLWFVRFFIFVIIFWCFVYLMLFVVVSLVILCEVRFILVCWLRICFCRFVIVMILVVV